MAHNREIVVLGGLGVFVGWGLAVSWLPVLRYLGYAVALGSLLSSAAFLCLLFLTTRGRNASGTVHSKKQVVAFISPKHWQRDVQGIRRRSVYNPKSLYPQSFVVSEAIDEALAFTTRDFLSSWYQNISPNPVFVNQVDEMIRIAVGNLRDRLLAEDLVSLIVSRIFPILTTHLKEFDVAERSVRGRNLTRNVTESEELDLAIASKYCEGRLHPAVALSLSDQKLTEQDYLRKISVGLLPQLLPESLLNSRVVAVLVREILACAVLFPLVSVLSDPDTWNQLMEAYGQTALHDRKTVRKLRAALDEHASPVPNSKNGRALPRLAPHDSERAFERFVRAIRRCNNLSDARLSRALIASQLKRGSMVDGQDQVYLRRLETGKRVLDQKVQKLSAQGSSKVSHSASIKSHFRRHSRTTSHEVSLVDVLRDPAGLSYFMEFMDRQRHLSLVQFWIVVDGFRNPLEDDVEDEAPAGSNSWTTTDRNDIALISETYLTKPEIKVTDESRQLVTLFLSAGKRATWEQYRQARTVILSTQSAVLEKMQDVYYPKFKHSDLYYKYIAADQAPSSELQTPAADQPSPRTSFEAPERRPLPPLTGRSATQAGSKSKDLRRAAVSSSDIQSMGKLFDDDQSPRHSIDSERSAPLFEDDAGVDPLTMSTNSLGRDSQNGENEANQSHVIETMEAALNDIVTDEPQSSGKIEGSNKNNDLFSSDLFGNDQTGKSPRGSLELFAAENRTDDRAKPSIASLGLIDSQTPQRGVFDDDLFPDQQKFIEDEYEEPAETDSKDPADEVHEAAPGDLGLTEAIEALTTEIDKLGSQDSVVETLTRKAELTNNTAELRILRKSKASIEREIRRKELQRQQYLIQESDNSLFGRSTVQLKSIVVGKEPDGREYALCKFQWYGHGVWILS